MTSLLSAGQFVTIKIEVQNRYDNLYPTWAFLKNLSLTIDMAQIDITPVYQCASGVADVTYDRTRNTICRSGCALADLTMLLNYYGVSLDTVTLNQWLNENNGYSPSGAINWLAIENYPGLNIHYDVAHHANTRNDQILNNELSNGNPVILRVTNPDGGSHFVLATGVSGNTWNIIDPGYTPQQTTLAERYNNHYTGTRVYRQNEP